MEAFLLLGLALPVVGIPLFALEVRRRDRRRAEAQAKALAASTPARALGSFHISVVNENAANLPRSRKSALQQNPPRRFEEGPRPQSASRRTDEAGAPYGSHNDPAFLPAYLMMVDPPRSDRDTSRSDCDAPIPSRDSGSSWSSGDSGSSSSCSSSYSSSDSGSSSSSYDSGSSSYSSD